MIGRLEDRSVLIEDEGDGNRLHGKGSYGQPMPGGGLELDLIEAAYLLEKGKLDIIDGPGGEQVSLEDLIGTGHAASGKFEVDYIVYRDLRGRGYLLKDAPEPFDFRMYERGEHPKRDPSKFWVLSLPERDPFTFTELADLIEEGRATKKRLLAAIVDEEGDITYYTVSKRVLKGEVPFKDAGGPMTASFYGDRVIIWSDEADPLYRQGFIGKRLGPGLQISLQEAAFLMEKGVIEIVDAESQELMDEKSFGARAEEVQADFEHRRKLYADLKGRGLIPKTGFKYGAHFRAYQFDPNDDSLSEMDDKAHARYLVHGVDAEEETTWPEVSRAVRLAHGVRKEMLFGLVGDEIAYIKIERIRP